MKVERLEVLLIWHWPSQIRGHVITLGAGIVPMELRKLRGCNKWVSDSSGPNKAILCSEVAKCWSGLYHLLFSWEPNPCPDEDYDHKTLPCEINWHAAASLLDQEPIFQHSSGDNIRISVQFLTILSSGGIVHLTDNFVVVLEINGEVCGGQMFRNVENCKKMREIVVWLIRSDLLLISTTLIVVIRGEIAGGHTWSEQCPS